MNPATIKLPSGGTPVMTMSSDDELWQYVGGSEMKSRALWLQTRAAEQAKTEAYPRIQPSSSPPPPPLIADDPVALAIYDHGYRTGCREIADDPENLPEQSGPRYPLMSLDREHASVWALFMYWLALLRWRWLTRRR